MSIAKPLLALLSLALVLTACAGGGAVDPETAAVSSAPPTSPAGPGAVEGAFPTTIAHRFGETTVDQAPERVVSVGFNDHDTLLALGTTPVGVREWYGEFPSATWEWAQDELGDAEPTVLSSAELDFEAIAALDPDLIVGIFSGMTESDYATLSQIAPTVANPEAFPDYGTPWRDVTRIYGQALGVPDVADDVIAQVEADIATARGAIGADGAEAVAAFYASDQFGAYAASDLRSRLLTDLGFTIPAEVDEVADGGFFAPVSLEQADLLDRDLVVWVTATEEEIQQLQELDALDPLGIRTEGREVVTDFLTNGAYSFSSPLSIPFLLDRLVPQLQAALDGDPATAVDTPTS